MQFLLYSTPNENAIICDETIWLIQKVWRIYSEQIKQELAGIKKMFDSGELKGKVGVAKIVIPT